MWSCFVVIFESFFFNPAGVVNSGEPAFVQAFISEFAVE
jgi:hypothetical protein